MRNHVRKGTKIVLPAKRPDRLTNALLCQWWRHCKNKAFLTINNHRGKPLPKCTIFVHILSWLNKKCFPGVSYFVLTNTVNTVLENAWSLFDTKISNHRLVYYLCWWCKNESIGTLDKHHSIITQCKKPGFRHWNRYGKRGSNICRRDRGLIETMGKSKTSWFEIFSSPESLLIYNWIVIFPQNKKNHYL